MGKISQVAAKYIIHASLHIDGVVEKPDIIGAVFGQTEGLLGSDLELRELQRNGRIGRIEVNTEIRSGKTSGEIILPSSLDKSETCIIGAAMEVIQRIGPCNAKIKVENIEDVRISKRKHVVNRAKDLLKTLTDDIMPDSQEIAEEVAQSVRVMEITEYGKERLPAGPSIEEAEEVIIVEGRADVLVLLKNGFRNVISLNGTSAPNSIVELAKEKTVTLFLDGDRGGDLIIKELSGMTEIDFVARAPDGKEVEELTKKEINKALRAKIAFEQVKMEAGLGGDKKGSQGNGQKQDKKQENKQNQQQENKQHKQQKQEQKQDQRKNEKQKSEKNDKKKEVKSSESQQEISEEEKTKFRETAEELIGTRGAYILDDNLEVMGKVPTGELETTIKSLNSGMKAVIFDGEINKNLVNTAEKANIKYLVGMENKLKSSDTNVELLTINDL